jgi:hypothetical protein
MNEVELAVKTANDPLKDGTDRVVYATADSVICEIERMFREIPEGADRAYVVETLLYEVANVLPELLYWSAAYRALKRFGATGSLRTTKSQGATSSA